MICQSGVKRTSGVIWILFLVGFLLPTWYLAGTIGQMVSIALHIITLEHFFMLSFIIAFTFSLILGTSVGTLSSIGIPIIGSAIALNLPIEIVAGALISGAFVGDRTSPFSSAHQLLAHTLEISVRNQFPIHVHHIYIGCFIRNYFLLVFRSSTISKFPKSRYCKAG